MAGAIRFLTHQPHSHFTGLPVVNFTTPMHDLYHQLPQLNSYQTFQPPLHQQPTNQYPIQSTSQESSVLLGISNFQLHPGDNQRPRIGLRKGELLKSQDGPHKNRRDGWGSPGYGNGGGNVGQSPAISALALLGFLFFLNLIQTSLQNNRNMLTTSTTTTVTTNTTTSNMMTTGTSGTVVGRNGRVRKRRGFGYKERRLTPDPIPTHPNRQIQQFLLNKDDVHRLGPFRNGTFSRGQTGLGYPVTKLNSAISKPLSSRSSLPQRFQKGNGSSRGNGLFSKFKRVSVNCLQLLSCKIGRSLFSEIGPTAGFMVRMIGDRIVPRSTLGNWKNRLIRALSNGWRSRRNCSRLYRRCALKNIIRPQSFIGKSTRRTRNSKNKGVHKPVEI